MKERTNENSDSLFGTDEVASTDAHRTLPRPELGLRLGVVTTEKALLPSRKCLNSILPAVANEKLGQEGRILVLGNGLAVFVEEGVAPGLDVLLVLGVILCPVVLHHLVETSGLPIGERLIHQAVATLGAR